MRVWVLVVLSACLGQASMDGVVTEPLDAGARVSPPAAAGDAGAPPHVDAGPAPFDAGSPPDAGRVSRPTASGTFRVLNLAYASGAQHDLDLYLPDGEGRWPLIVYVHGGAWFEGDRLELRALWAEEARRGYAVASLDYRLVPSVRWPAPLQDVKAAVRFLRANAAQYHLDPARFASWGASAGGHLATMLALSSGEAQFEDASLGHPSTSDAVQAVVSWYGPTDFLEMDAQTVTWACQSEHHDDPGSPESQLVDCAIQTCPRAVARANPITFVDRADPPALLMHGEVDCTVPPGQSVLLDAALRAAGVRSTLVLLPDVGHNFGDDPPPGTLEQVHAFLDATLYP